MQRTVAVLFLALLAAVGLWAWLGSDDAPALDRTGGSSSVGSGEGTIRGDGGAQDSAMASSNGSAYRAVQPDRKSADRESADRESADRESTGAGSGSPGLRQAVRVVDAATGVPIATGIAVTPTLGEVVAEADADGRLILDRGVEDVVFVAAGYWVGFVGAGSAQASTDGEHRIELVADRYTLPWRLAFTNPDGEPVTGVQFRLRSLDEPPPTATGVPAERAGATARADTKIQRAWQAHTAMCSLPAVERHVSYHLGVISGARRFRSDATGRAEVRFLATGSYLLEARAGDAVGRGVVDVRLGQDADDRIELVAGRRLSIEVRDASNGRPIVAANLSPRELPIGVDGVKTDANGIGSLGPLSSAPITVDITHSDFAATVVGPLRPAAGGASVVVKLVPKPQRILRGVVRELGSKTPVAGARVAAVDLDDVRSVVETGAGGVFELPTRLVECELRILSDHHQDYAEFLDTQKPPAEYVLIPKAQADRIRVGLTSVLRGTVVDGAGAPQPGTPVRWFPAQDRMPQGLVGRQIIRGGVLMLPPWSTADEAGRFELECSLFGRGRLLAVVGTTGPEAGMPLDLAAGTERDGLSLRVKK